MFLKRIDFSLTSLLTREKAPIFPQKIVSVFLLFIFSHLWGKNPILSHALCSFPSFMQIVLLLYAYIVVSSVQKPIKTEGCIRLENPV